MGTKYLRRFPNGRLLPVPKFPMPLLIGLLIVGCGANSNDVPRLDPKDQTKAAPASERKTISASDVTRILDLEEYPGAIAVENTRLVNPVFPPDEVRLELVRRSSDAPEKVLKFYEAKLGSNARGDAGHEEIFAPTKHGNMVRVHVDKEGTGSKFTIGAIVYIK